MPSAALLACNLATGRTHQIRVHLASIGHPLVGDPTYLRRIPAAAKGLAAPIRAALLDFPRQALHAARLGFKHPVSGAAMLFETPIPPDMQALLDLLDASEGRCATLAVATFLTGPDWSCISWGNTGPAGVRGRVQSRARRFGAVSGT